MLTKYSSKKALGRDLKESLLNEGGMTKQDFENQFKELSESQINVEEIDGLDVFTDPNVRNQFKTMTTRKNVSTTGDSIINLWLSFDSQYVLALCSVRGRDTDCMQLRAFDVETQSGEPSWVVEYTGKYLKMLSVEQNNEGKMFAFPYNDHGQYFVSIIDSNEHKEVKKLNVNQLMNIDKESIPIDGIRYPMISCCFTGSSSIFVSLYHRLHRRQYSFFYDIPSGKATQKQNCYVIHSTKINFSCRTFYNPEVKECYTFYRQGQVVTNTMQSNEEPAVEIMTNLDLGDMYFAYDQVLLVRSSSNFLIFKKVEVEEETEEAEGIQIVQRWQQIHKIKNMRGNIFFMRGNQRFQITTDDKIYIFIFKDKKTFIPVLESVMYNFMHCTQMIIGSKVKYCVTYKKSEPDFSMFQRTQFHNFKVPINQDNYEGAQGANLGKFNQYAISQKRVVNICNMRDFKVIQEFDVLEKGGITDDEVHILYFTVSQCQNRMGILLGKDLQRGQIQPTHLQIYENSSSKGKSWQKLVSRKFELTDACRQFIFDNNDNQVMYFFSQTQVIEYNFESNGKKVKHTYPQKLQERPQFGAFNKDQSAVIVTSPNDCLFMNMNTGKYVDLDDSENIRQIINIFSHEHKFYILANKRDNQLGFHLLIFDIDEPDQKCKQLVGWNHMLDIANADIQLLNMQEQEIESDVDEENDEEFEKKVTKKLTTLVVSFKMIGINTYNVFVIDLDTQLIKYWYESYQLWESAIKGFLLKTKEFMILSRDGIELIMLGNKKSRSIMDKDGNTRMLHSLCKMNYLRVEPTNHIYYQFQFYNDRQICIQDQYLSMEGNTMFDDIFKVKVHEPTLRELLMCQSIYAAKKLSDISELVEDQPDPTIFFKVFLELDLKCMTIHLAFDNKTIKKLLSQKNQKYFHEDNPIFYLNKDKRTAIDIALDNDQIKSVDLMIDYIVKYQNSYVYANLFKYNLVNLIERGVNVSSLMQSSIINYVFDYIEWPSTHQNTKKQFGSFNESVFRLRKKYKYIFPQLVAEKERFDEDGNQIEIKGGIIKKIKSKADDFDSQRNLDLSHDVIREYKIEYQLNQLGSMSGEDGDIIQAIAESDEVQLFYTDAVVDLIDYRWNQFAFKFHFVNVAIHFVYCFYLFNYVNIIFLRHEAVKPEDIMKINEVDDSNGQLHNIMDPEHDNRIYPPTYTGMLVMQIMLLVFPILIATTQFLRKGWRYWITPYYWIEILNIIFGLWSIYCQAYVGTWDISSKIVLIILIAISLLKTIFYLKVFKAFSYIVTMVISVVYDLQTFITFFVVLITFFSMLFNVVSRNASPEYSKLTWYIGNWLAVFRLSLGDFDFTLLDTAKLTKTHILFWCIWLLMVLFTALIFLNFIIAEVSNSYTRVRENVFSFIYKERAKLISEAEELLSKKYKKRNKDSFPHYIIVRQLEEG